jgi:hypothetical protein
MGFSAVFAKAGLAAALAFSAGFGQMPDTSAELSTDERFLGEEAPLSPEARSLRRSGNRIFWTGSALALGGLAVVFTAVVTDREQLALAGGLAYMVGVPLLGFGADRIHKAYRLYDPEVGRPGNTPWMLCGFGLGMQAVGTMLLIGGAESARGEPLSGGNGRSNQQLVIGALALLGGMGLHSVSWFQFAARRDAANRGLANAPLASLRVEPMVPLSGRGMPSGAGARLSLRF